MVVVTFVVPGGTPRSLLSLGSAPLKLPYLLALTPPIEVFLRILESGHDKLPNAYGLTLVTPSFHRWEAFPKAGALSSMAPQVPGVSPGSPLYP